MIFAIDDNGKRQRSPLFANDITDYADHAALPSGSMKNRISSSRSAAAGFVHEMLPATSRGRQPSPEHPIDPEDYSESDKLISDSAGGFAGTAHAACGTALYRGIDNLWRAGRPRHPRL